MTNHLFEEPAYVLICFAVGQSALVYAALFGLFFGADRLVTTWWRRRKAHRAR